MTSTPPVVSAHGRSLSVDEFVALSDELGSMVRAGIPLDAGFGGVSSRTSGELQALCKRLSERLSAGNSLDEAIAAEGARIPPLYRAVLSAGLRTRQLPQILASLSELTRSIADLRRQLRIAFIYPLSVLVLAWVLFAGFVWFVVPQLQRTQEIFQIRDSSPLRLLERLHESVAVWSWGIPVIVLAVVALSWLVRKIWRTDLLGGLMEGVSSALAAVVNVVSPAAARRVREFGASGSLTGLRAARQSQYSRLLAVLVEHEVPLPEALDLCADACADPRLQRGSRNLAQQVQSGQSLAEALQDNDDFPTLMRWMMGVGEKQSALGSSLRQLATVYEQRARMRMDWIRRLVPPAIVLLLGGAVTLAYGLTLFLPLTDLLRNLAQP